MISTTNFKTVIIDDFHPVLLEKLNNNKVHFEYLPEISKEDAANVIKDFEIVIVRSKINFSADLLKKLPLLKCIARGGAGMDNIDETAALEKRIVLINAPEGNRDAVAEHAIGLILAISNRIVIANGQVKSKLWNREENRGWEIGNKTIGIIGFGNTGQALAKKLNGFGCNIIAYDKYYPSTNINVEAVDLVSLLKQSDIICLHLPLTTETTGMVNLDFLNLCKTGAVMINTSRGNIVNQSDILKVLYNGKIGAFGADVLKNENFLSYNKDELEQFTALSKLPNVIMTPHVAGWTKESYLKIAEVIAQKVIDFTTK